MPRNKSYLTFFCCLKDFNKTTELAKHIDKIKHSTIIILRSVFEMYVMQVILNVPSNII